MYDFMSYACSFDLPFQYEFMVVPVTGMLTPLVMDFPELATCFRRLESAYFCELTDRFFFAFFDTRLFASMLTATELFMNLAVMLYFLIFLKFFLVPQFLSYYYDTKDMDVDLLLSSLMTESEKEISCIDDLLIIFLVIIYIFGTYFTFYAIPQLFFYVNNYTCMFIITLLLGFFIYLAPICLLYDFGIYLFVYLRGSGPTSALAVELMYDLINIMAYFMRVVIQLARMLLMAIAGGSLQEYMFYFALDNNTLVLNDFFLEGTDNFSTNAGFSLAFFSKLFLYILY